MSKRIGTERLSEMHDLYPSVFKDEDLEDLKDFGKISWKISEKIFPFTEWHLGNLYLFEHSKI